MSITDLLLIAAVGIATNLTPIGADSSGNREGTIPAWTGGLPVDAATVVSGHLSDPFADDHPLFEITAANLAEHSGQLSRGELALFAKYAGYRLPVYPTRRSVAFPKPVYKATIANAGRAQLAGVDGIEGAAMGIPFPQPRSGAELIWNHRLRYHGDASQWRFRRAYVPPNGEIEISKAVERTLYMYANRQPPAGDSMHSYNITYLEPCEDIYPDVVYLWHEPLNPIASVRRLWAFDPRSMRSYRSPPLGYDQVGICSHQLRYHDMLDMFSGAFDRYTFNLLGKREMYVPYNSYRLADGRVRLSQLLGRGHPDQADARYELHRVWVVEAVLRPGRRHAVSKRVFYIDEDSWSIVLADNYDQDGKLWRIQEGHLLPLYSMQGVDYAPTYTFDLNDGRYFADRLLTEDRTGVSAMSLRPADFAPGAAGRVGNLWKSN